MKTNAEVPSLLLLCDYCCYCGRMILQLFFFVVDIFLVGSNIIVAMINRMRELSNLDTRPAVQNVVEMPDCRGLPILGAITSILDSEQGKRLHEYVDERHRKYGPLFRGRVGPVKAIFVSSPEAIKKVFRIEGKIPQHFVPEAWLLYNRMRSRKRGLLFMEGDEWLTHRRILNRIMLGSNAITPMMKSCQKAAEDLVKNWNSYTNNDRIVPNLENQMYQWSIEVLLATLVGKSWATYRSSIISELEILSQKLGCIFEHSVHLSRISARLAKLINLPSWRGFVETADYALGTVDKFVEQMEKLEDANDGLMHNMIADGISGDVLKRIVVDLILAAGDTTAYSMQWLLFLMASNPEAQEKIHKALQGLSEAEIVTESLLKGAIKESLRLYPTAPFLTRILPQDTALAGYPAHKGELAVISLYSCGRDEANFPRAQEFLPERWLRNDRGRFEAVINKNATLPFANGARSCIGKKLAETQMSIMMAEILKHFKIKCLNKDDVTMKLRMISVPSEPLQIQLTLRN